MTRPTTLPNGMWGLLVVVCAIAACDGDEQAGADTARGEGDTLAFLECDSARVVSEASRADVVSWASGLTYHDADTSRAYIRGVPSTSTTLRIEAAGDARRRPRAVLRRGCIIGRIVSTSANTRLGVAVGTNYVWADSGRAGWQAVIIPALAEAPVRSFEMTIHDHTTATGRSAAFEIEGPCIGCEPAGWCRWPQDTTKAPVK